MASPSSVASLGFGSWGGVALLPTLGFGIGAGLAPTRAVCLTGRDYRSVEVRGRDGRGAEVAGADYRGVELTGSEGC